MRLTNVRITEFQSIRDSTEFAIGDITCLVGKNEAGKTALLKALYRLNPVIEADGAFDPTDDYPRGTLVDYEREIEAGSREPAQVVEGTYALETDDISAIEDIFGPECLGGQPPTLTLGKGYSNETSVSGLQVDSSAACAHLVNDAALPAVLTTQLLESATPQGMVAILADGEQTEAVHKLTPMLLELSERDIVDIVYERILWDRIPKFLYFDEYYQLKGQDNLNALQGRVDNNALETPDYPLLGLIKLAGLDLRQLMNPRRTEALIARLEAAENELTAKVLKYWSQNSHLRMTFDLRPALPEDPREMRSGMNILGRVKDTRHAVSTGLGTRSRGFVWFFSFLAWYSQRRREDDNIILLLDEPGLSLHGKAQEDLLRYFETELKPHNQLIYTTHSPFMVNPTRFDRVRIVQDLGIESGANELPEGPWGTEVTTEVLDATPDSLFPLQGALGYEIYQTLFVGPNCLVVEGVSDLLYIQTMSGLLQERGMAGLSSDWTITPVGGSDKVATFVALIGAQSNLKVAVLVDFQKKDRQSIENLYKRRLLRQQNVLTYATYADGLEADIEDMFERDFYLKLVNGAFRSSIGLSDLSDAHPRILRVLEKCLEEKPLPDNATFNHYRPARYFIDNVGALAGELSEELERFQRVFDSLNRLL